VLPAVLNNTLKLIYFADCLFLQTLLQACFDKLI